MKKTFKEYVEDCNYKDCPTKGNCKGCYGEYINEKEEIDPHIHNIILEWKSKGLI